MDSESSTRGILLILGSGLLIGLAIGAVVFFGFPAAPSTANETATPGGEPAPIVGAPAPDFTLTNLKGQPVTLSSFKSRPALINFWATWCGPCRTEMPAIEAAYQKYKGEGLVVLAVDFDEPRDVVAEFTNALGLTFEILLDPGATVNDTYRVRNYPTSFFVSRDGTIAAFQIGAMTEAQLFENLAKILPE